MQINALLVHNSQRSNSTVATFQHLYVEHRNYLGKDLDVINKMNKSETFLKKFKIMNVVSCNPDLNK